MAAPPVDARGTRLDGWEAIAGHLGVVPKTAQNYYKTLGLPVHKQVGVSGNRVYAFTAELETWQEKRQSSPPVNEPPRKGGGKPLVAGAGVLAACVLLAIGAGIFLRVPDERAPSPTVPATSGRVLWRVNSEGGGFQRIPLPFRPSNLAISRDGTFLYAIPDGQNSLAVVEVASRSLRIVPLPSGVLSVAASPDGHTVYLGSMVDDLISVDSSRNFEIQRRAAGGPIQDLAMTPNGSAIFAAMRQKGVKRFDVRSGEWTNVTSIPCPHFVSLDRQGKHLLISYQCGGPDGSAGHNTVEILDAKTLRSVDLIRGLPLVGGAHAFAPFASLVWMDGWDACSNPKYDGIGCPSKPSHVYHIYELEKRRVVKSLGFPQDLGGRPIFFPMSGRVLLSNPGIAVLEPLGTTIRERRRSMNSHPDAVFSPDGERLFLASFDEKEIISTDIEPSGCAIPEVGLAHFLPFDGGSADLVEGMQVLPGGKEKAAPGYVGSSLSLGDEADRLEIQSPSILRFSVQNTTLAFYLRPSSLPSEPVPLLDQVREDTWRGWRLLIMPGGEIALELHFDRAKSVRLASPPVVRPDQWGHVAVSVDNARMSIYWNGRLVAERNPDWPGSGRFTQIGDRIRVGWGTGTPARYRGQIDELAMWARTLEKKEIETMYRMRESAECKP